MMAPERLPQASESARLYQQQSEPCLHLHGQSRSEHQLLPGAGLPSTPAAATEREGAAYRPGGPALARLDQLHSDSPLCLRFLRHIGNNAGDSKLRPRVGSTTSSGTTTGDRAALGPAQAQVRGWFHGRGHGAVPASATAPAQGQGRSTQSHPSPPCEGATFFL